MINYRMLINKLATDIKMEVALNQREVPVAH